MKRKKNILDKIGSLIPGYKGYVVREEKRNSDKKFRDQLASSLSNSEEYVIRFQKELLNSKDMISISNWEMARKAINTIGAKIPKGISIIIFSIK
jgi:L-ribulose-5-phosphate 3-epimerase UlaE